MSGAKRIDVPVLIVGGGPTGVMAALLLARSGIACRVVERRDEPAHAPQAHVVNPRTLEICRAAGVDVAALEAQAARPADGGHVRWMTRLTGEELGALPYERQDDAVLGLTPTRLLNLSQHRFEPLLLDHARKQTAAQLCWSHEWKASEQDASGVTSRVHDARGGADYEVRSRYLVGADGAGSRVRKSLGIEMIGPAALGSFIMIHFEANLRPLVRERPAILYFLADPDSPGVFVAHDIDSTWVFMKPYDPGRQSPDEFDEASCRGIVRDALGRSDVDFEIRTIRPWTMTAQVAESYGSERTFLAGDAAHRFPPTGGLGLNTGVQDAHNLVWKLCAVEAGWAPASLLRSYETERRPVAQENCEQSLRNALRMLQVAQALGASEDVGSSRAALRGVLSDDAARRRVREAIANQQDHFDMLGLQLGFAYEEGAVAPDGSKRPAVANPVREFAPTSRPGHRLPHAWIDRDGARGSVLDLIPYDRFTLLTGPGGDAWREAVAGVRSVPIQCVQLGRDAEDPEGHWASVSEIEPDGALLVRPDQHVAWRSPRSVADPRAALEEALARILG